MLAKLVAGPTRVLKLTYTCASLFHHILMLSVSSLAFE